MTARLTVHNIYTAYDRADVLSDLSIEVAPGRYIDPYLAPKHSLPSFTGRSPNPMADLPASIEEILDEAEHLLSGQDRALNPVNMHFHTAIARASGNPILAQVLESLVDLYTQEQLAILEIFNARVRDYRDHILIFGAIRDHEPDLAARRMTRHLQSVRGVVEERMVTSGEQSAES